MEKPRNQSKPAEIIKAKLVVKGAKSVIPAWVENIAETGAMHHLAIEGVIVAKPMVDINCTDLLAFTEQTGVLAYIQVKGRQTANKKSKTGVVFIPTDKMTPIALPLSIDQDPLWFLVVYWMQEEVYLVFTGKELVSDFASDDGPKLLYRVGDTYVFRMNKAKLELLRKKGTAYVGNFRKIADALVHFRITDGSFAQLQAARHRQFIQSAKAAEDAYRNSSAIKKAKDALKAAGAQLPSEVQGKLEEELPDEDEASE